MSSVVESLDGIEIATLRAYAESRLELAAMYPAASVAAATEELVDRGMLQRHERGVLVTPEGLAALLDTAGLMRTASPPEATSADRQDAATRPSTARRTSGAPSSPRDPGPS